MNKLWRLILIYWPWRYPLKGTEIAYDPVLGHMVLKTRYEVDETKNYIERVRGRRWWFWAQDAIRESFSSSHFAVGKGVIGNVMESRFEDWQAPIVPKKKEDNEPSEFPTSIKPEEAASS